MQPDEIKYNAQSRSEVGGPIQDGESDLSNLSVPRIGSHESVIAAADIIRLDRDRFHEIVKGKVRDDLKKYLTSEDLVGKKAGDVVKIPIKSIEPPKFRYHSGDDGSGVGQGEGEVGDGAEQPGEADGAGQNEGEHILEEVSIADLADMLGEHLKLPRILPKGTDTLETEQVKYNNISKVGPDALRHNRRTIKQALLRQITEGTYNPDDPKIIPVREDFRYKAPEQKPVQKVNAAIIYLMDISGSMGEEEKSLAKITSFWINAWLDRQYRGAEKAYIVHDMTAQQVDEDTFFRINSAGGTMISSALLAVDDLIRRTFPPDQWNIYVFQFSDGDNYYTDNNTSTQVIKDRILPYVNQYAYAQVVREPRNMDFYEVLQGAFSKTPECIIAKIPDKDDIPDALKKMLGGGR